MTTSDVQAVRFARERSIRMRGFTGWSVDGGYAQYAVVPQDACVAIPPQYSDE